MRQRYLTAQFGPAHAGCAAVGYTLFDAAGAAVNGRTSAGIVELSGQSGMFGALADLPDGFTGSIVWDTGGSAPAFAVEEINPAPAEGADALHDSRVLAGGAGPVSWSYRLLNQEGRPIARADVHATTDPEGRLPVAIARTDAEGTARLRLEPGPVYLWRSRAGCVFLNPDVQTVEAV